MTRRLKHASMAVLLFGVGAILNGCANFDPESLTDIFNKKEKLPGERRPVFPGGVPGVTQGVPPNLMAGQQQKEAEIAAAPAPEPEKPKAAAKPKPPRTASRPARVTVSPEQRPEQQQQQQQQQSGADAPWPAPATQQPAASSSPWPSAPSSGTFQR